MVRMTVAVAFALALVVVPLAVLLAQEDPEAFPPDDVAEILVLGPDGRPVSGADVEVLGEPAFAGEGDGEEPAVVGRGTTGEDGRVRIPVIPFARYLLRVSCAPFATAGDIQCWGGNVTTFRLAMPGGVRGVVRDDTTGKPVAGADVYVYDWSMFGMVRSWRLETDNEGKYSIQDAAPGYLNVEAWASEYGLSRGQPAPRVVAGGEVRCDVDLQPAITLRLTVLDDRTGEPIPEVEVESTRRSVTGPGAGLTSPPVMSWPVPGTAGRAWNLTVKAPGYTEKLIPETPGALVSPPPEALTVRLTPAVPVSGTVVGGDGAPVVGMDVFLCALKIGDVNVRMPVRALQVVTTGVDGSFSAHIGIPGGGVAWQLSLGGAWCRGPAVDVPVDAKAVRLEPISLGDGVEVRGRVAGRDGTHPIKAMISVHPAVVDDLLGAPFGRCILDPRGRYRFPWVPKGSVKLTLNLKGHPAQVRTVDIDEDTVVDFELPAK